MNFFIISQCIFTKNVKLGDNYDKHLIYLDCVISYNLVLDT